MSVGSGFMLPVVGVVGLLLSFGSAHALAAIQKAQAGGDIWKGIFTDAQAASGDAVFREHCATCHDANESGEAPALAGDTFMRSWEGHDARRLYTKILETMPANNVESVSPEQKLDVLTYILRENGFPPGSNDLEVAALGGIQIVPRGGPAPPRTGAMVAVVGCLTEAQANAWTLTSATDPVVTTLSPSTAAGSTSGQTLAVGTRTIRLLSVFPSPKPYTGQRIEVKGFLVRADTDVEINVVTLRSLAAVCR